MNSAPNGTKVSSPLRIHWVTTVASEKTADLAYLSCDCGNLKIFKLDLSLIVGNLFRLDFSCHCQNLKIFRLDLSCHCQNLKIFKLNLSFDCQNLEIFKICGSVLSLVNFCEVTTMAIIYRKTLPNLDAS